tara:strand:+ start:10646 stop:14854 length:4209 start_codon:yes stop_codon:yes gene_type:complete
MPKIKNIFTRVMDKDSNRAYIKQGFSRHIENLRFLHNDENDGVGVNIKGSLEVSDATVGNTDLKCITALFNENLNVIYYYLASTDGLISKIVEYNITDNTTTIVSEDNNGTFNFDKTGFITGINEFDGRLFWSEWGNNPRRIDVERAKTYGLNGFTEEDIQVVLIPPHQKPTITLQDTGSEKENNIEEKFLSFAYQWKYLDGDYSILSPFSEVAFQPSDFDYDYTTQSNRAMVNKYNQVKIDFNTGSERVTDIRLVFKESESNSEWVIDDFNKELLSYGDNTTETFLFDNSKTSKALSDNVIRNFGNSVPLEVKSQTYIDGRILYAYYKEYYDLLDSAQEKIEIDYSLELVSLPNSIRESGDPLNIIEVTLPSVTHAVTALSLTLTITTTGLNAYDLVAGDPITLTLQNAGSYTITSVTDIELVLLKSALPYPTFSGVEANAILYVLTYTLIGTLIPKKTVKSYRDYEGGIIYLDEACRPTTILVSKTNTLFIPNDNCISENSIDVILKHKPPSFAKYYRFFIKQSKKTYDTILPLLYYTDGVYRWIKLEGSDKDKISEGDYLTVKSDANGILNVPAKVKVLEIKTQLEDFINTNQEEGIGEKAGLYFRIKPEDFRLDEVDLTNFTLTCLDNNTRYNNITNMSNYISNPHWYGVGINDLTSTGVYTGAVDDRNRYIVKIESELGGSGGVDTFDWSDDNGATWTLGVDITVGAISLSVGVEITFANTTGHTLDDEWVINARASWTIHDVSSPVSDPYNAYGFFRTVNNHNELLDDIQDEVIQPSARLYFKYEEISGNTEEFIIDEISSARYDNIQEWFYKENIIDIIAAQSNLVIDDIHFMRGNLSYDDQYTKIDQEDATGTMTMCVRSYKAFPSTVTIIVNAYSEAIQYESSNLLIFETEPKEQPLETYYEIGKTYDIVDDFHISDSNIPSDIDQSSGVDLRVKLDFFNAFSFGNGIESYKIKDEFNRKGMDVGIRTLTTTDEEYKEVIREADITWSGRYDANGSFNQLSTFNASLINFISLDKEEGSIQKLHNAGGNLLVIQEGATGLMPYNKNVIYDTQGGAIVGVANNVLDSKSYKNYGRGKHGISKNPESFVQVGGRFYYTDQMRGDFIQLANDGETEINQNLFEYKFSTIMADSKDIGLVGGYDPKHKEVLIYIQDNSRIPSEVGSVLAYKEVGKGFSSFYTFKPDFMVHANNELYAWENGVMHKMNATTNYNQFFGVQYESRIKFFVNMEFSTEKVFKAMGLESTHAWLANIATKLTSRTIPKESFTKIEDYWFSEILGNTNAVVGASSIFGLGSYAIVSSTISVANVPNGLCIGDFIISNTLLFPENKIINVQNNLITLQDSLDADASFLMYKKNQNIEGLSIKGDILEVELISDETTKLELRAVNIEVSKSNYS